MIPFHWLKNLGLLFLVAIQGILALLAFRQINYDQDAIEQLSNDISVRFEVLNRLETLSRQAYTLFLYDTTDVFVTPDSLLEVLGEMDALVELWKARSAGVGELENLSIIEQRQLRLHVAVDLYAKAEKDFSSDRELLGRRIHKEFSDLFRQLQRIHFSGGLPETIIPPVQLETFGELAHVAEDLFRQMDGATVHQPEVIVRMLALILVDLDRFLAQDHQTDEEALVRKPFIKSIRSDVSKLMLNLPSVYNLWRLDPNLSYLGDEVDKLSTAWDQIQVSIDFLTTHETQLFQEEKAAILQHNKIGKYQFFVVAIAGLGIALTLAYLLSRVLRTRLAALVAGLEHYGRGNYDYRLPLLSKDHLTDLAQSFNQLADNLAIKDAALNETVDHLTNSQARLQEAHALLEIRVAERTFELKAANDKLLLMGKVFNHAREGILVADYEGRIIMVNPGFLELTGYREADILGKKPIIFRMDFEGDYFGGIREKLKASGVWEGELTLTSREHHDIASLVAISRYTFEDEQIAGHIAVFRDLRKLKEQEDLIRHQAYHDSLTGLPNRRLLADRLGMAIAHARRNQQKVGILFLDLDNFKKINDSMGHSFGDDLLINVGIILEQIFREEDTISRIGGDEFVVVLSNVYDEEIIRRLAAQVVERMAAPMRIQQREVYLSVSVGISIFPDHGDSVEDLLKNADMAMYSAKDQGKNTFRHFTPALDEKTQDKLILEEALRIGLGREEFQVYYQPQVDIDEMRLVGAEGLVRWISPEHGLVSPARFIPLCEETGLILPLGRYVLRTVCQFAAEFCRQPGYEDVRFSFNVSAKQFADPQLLPSIINALDETGLSARNLEVEITESFLMHHVEYTRNLLVQLEKMGVSIAVDDFGTGYSSLAQLKNFPIHTLKIDRSFVRDLVTSESDKRIVEAVIAMARHLGIEVIAEGVETVEQKVFLQALGCDKMQGYLVSPPVEIARFEEVAESLRNPPPDPPSVLRVKAS